LSLQGRELLAGRSALLAAQRAVGEKSAAVAAVKQELWEAKQTMTRQAGLLEAVAHDIFQVRLFGTACTLLGQSLETACQALPRRRNS
jgi:hypothetical protein